MGELDLWSATLSRLTALAIFIFFTLKCQNFPKRNKATFQKKVINFILQEAGFESKDRVRARISISTRCLH